MERHQKKAELDCHRLKTMVKRSIEQNLRMKNFAARNGKFETSAVVKNHRMKQREQRSLENCWQDKDYLGGTCNGSSCEKWHPPECLFYKSENGCKFGEKCSCAHRQVDEEPSKKSQKNGDKSAVAKLKSTRQVACVFQDMEPPKYSSILRKSSNILKPIRCVRLTKAVLRHANIRDQNPSLGMICPGFFISATPTP